MIGFEIGAIALLIIINGLLAMSELAVVSSRPARLRAMVEQNVSGSRRAVVLASNPSKFLSTVQIGITLVGILSGAISGATLGQRLAIWLEGNGFSEGLADALGVGGVVAIITYASLIIGELVPKQIALRNPEKLAVKVAPAMTVLAQIASPLVWLLDRSGKLVMRGLGQHGMSEDRISEHDIKTLIAEAETSGVLEPGEREMISGVMRLGDRSVRAMMTPRRDVEGINLLDGREQNLALIIASVHSRLPVCDGDSDNVLGVIFVRDLLKSAISGGEPELRSLIKEAPVIPDSADALDVISILKAAKAQMGIIHDEYGHFEGIVTTADILETIAGAFGSEEDPAELAAVQRADGSYLISGWMPVDELSELIRIPISSERGYHTAAGFMVDALGALPTAGTSIDMHGWRFEVVDMDGRRIDKILAGKIPATRRIAT